MAQVVGRRKSQWRIHATDFDACMAGSMAVSAMFGDMSGAPLFILRLLACVRRHLQSTAEDAKRRPNTGECPRHDAGALLGQGAGLEQAFKSELQSGSCPDGSCIEHVLP